MPKLVTDHSTSNRSAYLTQPPRRRSSCRAVTPPAHATAAQHLPHSPVSPPKPSVPAWIRRDWSDSSFGIPSFSGDSNPCAQISWAARNASVAVHDVFQYHAGRWDSIQDTAMCIYLAIVDVVLQKYVRTSFHQLTLSVGKTRLSSIMMTSPSQVTPHGALPVKATFETRSTWLLVTLGTYLSTPLPRIGCV
jgi:hypothetical protein